MTRRMTIEISDDTGELLDRYGVIEELNPSQLFNRALALYAVVQDLRREGRDIYIHDPFTNTTKQMRIE